MEYRTCQQSIDTSLTRKMTLLLLLTILLKLLIPEFNTAAEMTEMSSKASQNPRFGDTLTFPP